MTVRDTRRYKSAIEEVLKVADNLMIDSFHKTACKPESSEAKYDAAEAIRAAVSKHVKDSP